MLFLKLCERSLVLQHAALQWCMACLYTRQFAGAMPKQAKLTQGTKLCVLTQNRTQAVLAVVFGAVGSDACLALSSLASNAVP